MSRRLIVLIDGSACSAAQGVRGNFTNAMRIGIALNKVAKGSSPQLVLYFSGPGSRSVPSSDYNSITGAETKDIVIEAYLSLCNNISSKNDKIYLFGFSRGGVAAKALAGLICRCGLLAKDSFHFLRQVWKCYEDGENGDSSLFQDRVTKHSIAFVGLFDPVHGPKHKGLDLKLRDEIEDNIDFAVELFSLDEARSAFDPHIWTESRGVNLHLPLAVEQPTTRPLRLQQIWMPGGHSDLGNPANKTLLADIAFLTMMERIASKSDLSINKVYLKDLISQMRGSSESLKIETEKWFWSRSRTMPSSGPHELHAIADMLNGREMIIDGKSKKYELSNRLKERFSNCPRYGFEISPMFKRLLPDAKDQVWRSIADALSTV